MLKEVLNDALHNLHAESGALTSSAIVSIDGLPIVSVLERNIDSNRVGSLSAALLSLCGQTARLLSCGNFNQMTLQGQQGEVLLMQISDDLALVSTTKAGSRMGLVLVQLRRTVEEIRRHLNGIITHANEAFVTMSAWSREELIGQPHSILRHPDMPKAAFADLWHTVSKGEKWHGYVKNLRKDGRYYWVYATVIPNIRNGKIEGYTSVRRRASAAMVAEISDYYQQLCAQERD